MPTVRYQPLGPLLSGKGSRAFLALEVPEGAPRQARPVVLVWMPEEIVKDPQALSAVDRETQRAVVLEHPNIIRCHGLSRSTEGVARVVEYADGETCRRVLEVATKLPVHFAARVAIDAATGIHYAHMAGNDDGSPMVHGDLRPETLLISYAGVTKVSGYGALAVAPKEPGGRRVRGRREHCAPEQILGGRNAVNVQTDVYLLGLLLYECLCGKVAFEGTPDFDQAVLSTPLPDLAVDQCPRALMAVIKRSMSKRANERYPTALAFREAVELAVGATVADSAAFALYIKKFFPEMEPARAARQRMINEAMAKYGGALPPPPPPEAFLSAPRDLPSGAELSAALRRPEPSPAPAAPAQARPLASAAPSEAPAVPSVAAAKPPTEPPAATASPPPPPQAEPDRPSTPAAQKRKPSAFPVGLGAAAAVVLLGGVAVAYFLWQRLEEFPRFGGLAPGDAGAPSAGAGVPSAGVSSAGVSSMDAGTPVTTSARADGGMARLDGGSGRPDGGLSFADGLAFLRLPRTDGGARDGGDGGLPNPGLALMVDPAVDVTDTTQDNKVLGRTPFTVGMSAGKHVLHFTEKYRGIDTSRAVQIPDAGLATLNVYLSKGYIAVDAPPGSDIFIDGHPFGKAPARELGVYEGFHRIMVMVGQARWQESFDIKPNERLRFSVEFQDESEE